MKNRSLIKACKLTDDLPVKYTAHSSVFFGKIVRIEHLPVRTTMLVSYVPRRQGSVFKVVGGGRQEK